MDKKKSEEQFEQEDCENLHRLVHTFERQIEFTDRNRLEEIDNIISVPIELHIKRQAFRGQFSPEQDQHDNQPSLGSDPIFPVFGQIFQ